MPYAHEHAARIIEPSKFEQDSFRRKNIAEGIDIILGKLKGEDTMTVQAYRFNADKFTPEEAKKWLKDHDIKYISFEAAAKNNPMNSIKFKTIQDCKIKAEGEDFIIEGYASVFNVIDSDNDIVEPGAFTKTLSEMKDRICLCYQHDLQNPIGKMIELKEDSYGLWFQSRISDAEPGVKQKIKENILKEFSIGYSVMRYEQQNVDNARPIMHLKELKLWEISLVTLASNEYANLQAIKSVFGIDTIEEEFDKLIINEKNHIKKFELLKLKHISLSAFAPDNTTQNRTPETVISQDEINYLTTYLKLI